MKAAADDDRHSTANAQPLHRATVRQGEGDAQLRRRGERDGSGGGHRKVRRARRTRQDGAVGDERHEPEGVKLVTRGALVLDGVEVARELVRRGGGEEEGLPDVQVAVAAR